MFVVWSVHNLPITGALVMLLHRLYFPRVLAVQAGRYSSIHFLIPTDCEFVMKLVVPRWKVGVEPTEQLSVLSDFPVLARLVCLQPYPLMSD